MLATHSTPSDFPGGIRACIGLPARFYNTNRGLYIRELAYDRYFAFHAVWLKCAVPSQGLLVTGSVGQKKG